MSTQSRLLPRIGGFGIVYTALFVVANLLIGSGKSESATGAAVVTYYQSRRGVAIAAVFVVALAAIVFTFFLSSLRRALGVTAEGRHLAPIVTAGGAVYVVGLLFMAVFQLALVDAAHYHMTEAAQTLNVLGSDDWVPVVAGLSMIALATGISALRSAGLPRWLAWASIALGVLAVAGPLGGLAFLVAPVWTLVTGIVLLRGFGTDGPTETAAAIRPGRGAVESGSW